MEQRQMYIFSIKMDPQSDASLRMLASAVDRPRGWVVKRLIRQAVESGDVRYLLPPALKGETDEK